MKFDRLSHRVLRRAAQPMLRMALVLGALLLGASVSWAEEWDGSNGPDECDLYPRTLWEFWEDQGFEELDPEPDFTWGLIRGYRFVADSCNQPAMFVSVDYFGLDREGTRNVDFVSRGTGTTSIVLSTESLDEFELSSGLRLTVGAMLTERILVAATFWGVHHWEESCSAADLTPNAVGGVGNLFSPFSGFGQPAIPGVDFINQAQIGFSSELLNAEINSYRLLPERCGPIEAAFCGGLRYVRLEEHFNYATGSQFPAALGTTVTDQIETENHLYGGQMGMLIDYWITPRCWAECEVKTGLYHNAARLRNVFTQTTNGVVAANDDTVRNGRTAFIGELMAGGNFRVTPSVVVRAGYQIIWIDGVAVAEENFSSDFAVQSQGTPKINTNGTMVFHGPHMGMTMLW